ncbi:hypothetical protein [Streptomyces osmaniensis]|uniref:Uncharacterized protein n=1 Tax=Streptomyces osmaniensis TaxID=593134 RepID=A0ABP6YY43_9ACTN|nr:hypothetical protein KJK32_47035 [Streptomyces sp. JCM17656]
MAAQLAATVYVTDPDTHQTVELAEGTCPEPRLAALVPNPAAWVDGKLPRLPKTQGAADGPTGDGPDDASGASSDASGDGEPKAAPAAKKTAARKTAASKPARGRDAADQGDSGD